MDFQQIGGELINSAATAIIVAAMSIAAIRSSVNNLKNSFDEFKVDTKQRLTLIETRMWDGNKNRRIDDE